ncbi:hypothetical protein [Micromonospora sp. LOL_024]|uniref:WXG100 family type VII secretion target n=1 Tax=Micromonospora sp. LOL_024 TaxID=3345412 RepID=UPI003A8B67B7
MSEDYYGWQPPTYHMYSGVSDDYAAERAADATPYQPTAWGEVTVEQMWEFVRKESDERTTALADMWQDAASLLEVTRANLKRHADGLRAKWQSPAASVFMGRVGGTLHSLDEWEQIAANNAAGLRQLATKIAATQRDMRQLWLEYKAEQQRQEDIYEEDKKEVTFGDIFGDNHKSYEEVQSEFHQRAKNIAKPLADLYIDVYISNISRGGKFKGPTDAVLTNAANVPRPGRPGAPGAPPGAQTVNGSRPDRPNMPTRPDVVDRPAGAPPPPAGLPEGVGLAGGAAPTAPPGAPPAAPPVSTPNATAPPGPVAPPMAGPGPRPTKPGANSGSRPNVPRTSLPGSGGPGAPRGGRGPAPNRPTLPGSGGPGGGSGAPPDGKRGSAPNRPTLPGNTGAGRPGGGPARPGLGARPGTSPAQPPSSPRLPGSTARPGQGGNSPGRPAAPPPSLGGQRGTTSGTPKAGPPLTGRSSQPPGARTGSPPKPGTSGGGTRPDLSGRAGSGTGRPAPTTGPAPSLGGRRAGSAGPGPRRGTERPDADQETWEYGEGDDELWVTGSSAVGVVGAPAEHRPREQGRALGQG